MGAMRTAGVFTSILIGLATACGSATPSTTPTGAGSQPTGGVEPATGAEGEPAPASGAGDIVAACKACVAEGKNWTAGRCEADCYMDTYCYGPGNQGASTCSDDPAAYEEVGAEGI